MASSTTSATQATASEATSSLKKPGRNRRTGFTAKSVSAIVNWASGFRAGARSACIQKRTSADRMKRLKIVSTTKAMAWLSIAQSLPNCSPSSRERSARGLHGLDEARLEGGAPPSPRGRARWCRPSR